MVNHSKVLHAPFFIHSWLLFHLNHFINCLKEEEEDDDDVDEKLREKVERWKINTKNVIRLLHNVIPL